MIKRWFNEEEKNLVGLQTDLHDVYNYAANYCLGKHTVCGNILDIIGVLHKIGAQVRVINVATVLLFY